jgi:hypothetical protein
MTEAVRHRSLVSNLRHFATLDAGFGRRSLLAFFQFPFPVSGDWFGCYQRPVRGIAIIEANAAVKLVGEQEDVPPDPLGSAVDNFGKSNERFATVNASSDHTSRVRGVMAASFLRSSRSNSSRFAQDRGTNATIATAPKTARSAHTRRV